MTVSELNNGMVLGGFYNWVGQNDQLIYIGDSWSGDAYLHQFVKENSPDEEWREVWCEVLTRDLHMLERTEKYGNWKSMISAPKDGTAIMLYSRVTNKLWSIEVGYFNVDHECFVQCQLRGGNTEFKITEATHWDDLPNRPHHWDGDEILMEN